MQESDIECPYCGETITIFIDGASSEQLFSEQQYVEDCQVCCSPILIHVLIDADGSISSVTCRQENE